LADSVVTLDPELPRARALVTEGGQIVFVGAEEEARRVAGPEALVERSRGTIVPGFNDNHLHLVIFGDHADAPDLTGLDAKAIVETMRDFAATVPGQGPLVGYAWDYPACPDPSKEVLDEVFPDRPVALAQFGGHGMWVNSAALRLMGIDHDHPPKVGQALVDEWGEPTGILREVLPNPLTQTHFHEIFYDSALREPRIRRALDEARRHGITSVQDNSWYHPVLTTLRRLHRTGELTARVSCWALGREPATLGPMARGPFVDGWVSRGPLKNFLDGTFTTRTAWMDEAYPGHPGEFGMGFDPAWLEAILRRLVRQKGQGAFHSIGDRSTATFLDVWERVVARQPEGRALRMRLEHVQALRPGDLARLKDLGVCVAAQPPALATPDKDIAILGRDRALKCYPHRSILDTGIPLSFGSDIPGEAFCDPIRGMHLVCNREGPERIEPLEALTAYTRGSAYVEFQEHRKGILKPGYFADFTVLSDDPLTVDRRDLGQLQAQRTVVAGRTVWDRWASQV
jgi:predicted amidohydrolase YtcJ